MASIGYLLAFKALVNKVFVNVWTYEIYAMCFDFPMYTQQWGNFMDFPIADEFTHSYKISMDPRGFLKLEGNREEIILE